MKAKVSSEIIIKEIILTDGFAHDNPVVRIKAEILPLGYALRGQGLQLELHDSLSPELWQAFKDELGNKAVSILKQEAERD